MALFQPKPAGQFFGGSVKTTATINRKVIKAVETSMRIEGCKPAVSVKTKAQAQAKALMEQQRVQVSVPGK
jgi:hypothetical protein